MRRLPIYILASTVFFTAACAVHTSKKHKISAIDGDTIFIFERTPGGKDSLGRTFIIIENDTLHTSFIPDPFAHSGPLREEDFEEIAREIDVETAAIKAIVEIETGKTHRGFHTDGKPIINFDLTLFRRAAARRGINLSKYKDSPALKPVDIRKYGSQQAAQHARLDAAMAIDSIAAIESTFWGLFQIGGFNWKLAGAPNREAFVEKMSKSEYEQLRMFADFMNNTGLLKHLRSKNWAAFARLYNGPAYASRGYHTRMATAYKKYKKQQTAQQQK